MEQSAAAGEKQTMFFHLPSCTLPGRWTPARSLVCEDSCQHRCLGSDPARVVEELPVPGSQCQKPFQDLCSLHVRQKGFILFWRVLQHAQGLSNWNSWKFCSRPGAHTVIHAWTGPATLPPAPLGGPPVPIPSLSPLHADLGILLPSLLEKQWEVPTKKKKKGHDKSFFLEKIFLLDIPSDHSISVLPASVCLFSESVGLFFFPLSTGA